MEAVEVPLLDTALTPDPAPSQSHTNPIDRWATIQEGSSYSHLCDATLRRAIARQELRAVRIGSKFRIRLSWLDDWLERKTAPPLRTPEQTDALKLRMRKAVAARWDKREG